MPDSIDIFYVAALADDADVRRQGIGFIDGSISGYALLMGDDVSQAPAIIESLVQQQVVVFITKDRLIASLREVGHPLGWNSGIVPLSIVNELGFFSEIALGLIGFEMGYHIFLSELRLLSLLNTITTSATMNPWIT